MRPTNSMDIVLHGELINCILKSVNTEFGRRATMFKGAQDWNKLPANLRIVQSRHFESSSKLNAVAVTCSNLVHL